MQYTATAICFLLACLAPRGAAAQLTPDRYLAAAALAPDLALPTEASPLNFLSAPRLALYRPQGSGPFPALVLHHPCSGLRNGRNTSMLNWARQAVARGYVVLLLDSLGPRGVDSVCFGAKGGVNFARGLKDALQAAEHLRKFDFVDAKRVAFAGYSWGAGVGLLVSSRTAVEALGRSDRYAAIVAFYPPCHIVPPNGTPPFDLVVPEIDRPLLVLMGKLDNETPPDECAELLAPLAAAGAPVQWHLYPGATHCWDCDSLDGNRKTDSRGHTVVYRYDKDVTGDSGERMFAFIEKAFAAQR